MLMTANITRSFTSMFTKVYNYRFTTNGRFAYIMRTIRFTNTQWFGMMTNTIYNKNISIVYITIDLLTFNALTCKDLQMAGLLTSDLRTLSG